MIKLVGVLVLLAAGVQAAELKVMTAGAYKPSLLALAPEVERATGHRLVIDNDTAGGVAGRVKAGEALDIVVLPVAGAASLGALLGPVTPLAKVGVAVAVREGAPVPDISSAEAVRKAVLAARAPSWIAPESGGSSGIYLEKLFAEWGILDTVKPRAVRIMGGLVGDKIASGEADFGFQQRSELMGHAGVHVVGPLPPGMQLYTVYAGAAPAKGGQQEAAKAVLAWLAGPGAEAALVARGMERP